MAAIGSVKQGCIHEPDRTRIHAESTGEDWEVLSTSNCNQGRAMSTETSANSSSKIAIVTGGSRGLGRNTALSLAQRGVDSIFTYRSNQAEAEKVVGLAAEAGRKAIAMQLNTGDVSAYYLCDLGGVSAMLAHGPLRQCRRGTATSLNSRRCMQRHAHVRRDCKARGLLELCSSSGVESSKVP